MRGPDRGMVACHQQGADEPSAYKQVLGNTTLFARRDYAEEARRVVDSVLKTDMPVHEY